MLDPHELDRCPWCGHDGHTFDAVCKLWCCGRCYLMEAADERERRQVGQLMRSPADAEHGAAEPVVPSARASARRLWLRSCFGAPRFRRGSAAILTRPRGTASSPPRPHFG